MLVSISIYGTYIKFENIYLFKLTNNIEFNNHTSMINRTEHFIISVGTVMTEVMVSTYSLGATVKFLIVHAVRFSN